jgi:16S rRNA (cytosine967-C5)-methyltransferase
MVVTPESDSENSRLAAARIVSAWLKSQTFPDREFDSLETSRAFIMEMALGIVRWYGALNWIRDRLAPQKPRPDVDACILVGLYQLLFMDDVQEYAAVNETVEAARSAGGEKVAGFVNAVLRRAQAEKQEIIQALEKQSVTVRLSHPRLLVDRWTKQFGSDAAIRLCEWNNRRADVVLRLNTNLADSHEITGEPHPFDPDRFLILPRGVSVTHLPGFANGWFYVQDPSTSVAPALLNPQPGEIVLDACAAPGGKTMLIAERMQGRGTLVAMDPSADRLKSLRENIARLKWNFIRVVKGDITKEKPSMRFNAILLDVPCTNTGVIRRRPDARWRFSPERLLAACGKQAALLDAAAVYLESGGRIVYSTCSLELEENDAQVDRWLCRHAEFKFVCSRKLFPPESGTDGAYAALLIKK